MFRASISLRSPLIARLVLMCAFVALAWTYYRSRAPIDYQVTVVGAPFSIGAGNVTTVTATPVGRDGQVVPNVEPTDLSPEPYTADDGKTAFRVRLRFDGCQRVLFTAGGVPSQIYVRALPASTLALAMLLLSVIAVFVPYALSGTAASGAKGAWYQLLSEPKGGYSLSRVQLFVWFLPAAILYGALSFTQQGFAEINAQISLLLGLSGATTLLGTATSPSAATSSKENEAPDLRDMVQDWNEHGDVSRYQYLLLSVVGVLVMIAAFWRRIEMPTVPSQFLYLVAGSQGTYLMTKAIKGGKTASTSETEAPVDPATQAPADS